MRTHQLRYVVSVGREGSFSGAARALGLAQPALSQQIGCLEDELGVKLFTRSTRGVKPTTSGEILIAHAEAILDRMEVARRDVLVSKKIVAGEVTMSISDAIADALVPKLLEKLNALYPEITLRVTNQSSQRVQTSLENSRIDLGVLPDHADLSKLFAEPLFSQPLYYISRKDLRKTRSADGSAITFAEIAKSPLVMARPDHPARRNFEKIAEAQNTALNVPRDTNSLLMMISYVQSGLMNTILPYASIRDKTKLGYIQARKIIEPEISLNYFVAWPKSRPLNTPTTATIEVLKTLSIDS